MEIARGTGKRLRWRRAVRTASPGTYDLVVNRQVLVCGAGQRCGRAHDSGDLPGISRIITRKSLLHGLAGQRLLQCAHPEIEAPKLVKVGGSDHSCRPGVIRNDHRASGRESLDCRSSLCKHDIILAQYFFGSCRGPARIEASNIEPLNAGRTAFVTNSVVHIRGVIAEHKNAARLGRKRLTRQKAVEVGEIVDGGDLARSIPSVISRRSRHRSSTATYLRMEGNNGGFSSHGIQP